MATLLRASMTDHSVLDDTGDDINGSEVDENSYVIADILDGTTQTDLASANRVDFLSTSTHTTTREAIRLINLDASAAAVQDVFRLEWDPASGNAINGQGIGIVWYMPDSVGGQDEVASIDVVATDVTSASEDYRIDFSVITAGSVASELQLSGASLNPTSNDGLALGTTSLGFADLHLATGGVINWANGEVTITETDANTLTVAGMTALALGASSVTAGSVLANSNDVGALGSVSASWSDLFLAAGGVINWANGEVTLTESDANTLTLGGGNLALGTGTLTGGAVLANSNDVGALGASGTAWSDLFLASGAVINFNAGDVTETHAANTLTWAGASSGYVFNDGILFIGDTANTDMTLGLTINQGGADNAILSLKSSDVAHGMTTKVETDTYMSISKLNAALGGVYLKAWNSGAAPNAIVFDCANGTSNTAKTNTTANPIVVFNCHTASGTGYAAPAADANLFGINDDVGGVTRWLLDMEGDMYSDGSNNIFDSFEDEAIDDVALLSTFDSVMSKSGAVGLIESEFEDFLRYDEDMLIKLKVLGGPRANVPIKGRGMINWTALSRLQVGAIRQLGRTINQQQQQIAVLEGKLLQLAEEN